MADAYQILGVAKDATEEEIRSAHRSLARRWHPDRFPEGPERLWAEEKMIQINLAYEEVMKHCPIRHRGRIDKELEDIRRLLGENQLAQARQALLRITARSAEWNYLFGAVLFRLGEVEKSLLYFSIAAKKHPENTQYYSAYRSAESILQKSKPHFSPLRFLKNAGKTPR